MTPRADLAVVGARRLWPVVVAIVAGVVLQKVLLESGYEVGGHAAEHLAGATAPFPAATVIFVLLWATPGSWRQVEVLGGCAAWFAATVLVLVGNLRVVDSLVAAGLADVPTDGIPDIADHGLANTAPWLGVVAAVITVAAMWRRRHIGTGAAVAAGVVSLLFPPWIIPGAGMPVLAISRCVARTRQDGRASGSYGSTEEL